MGSNWRSRHARGVPDLVREKAAPSVPVGIVLVQQRVPAPVPELEMVVDVDLQAGDQREHHREPADEPRDIGRPAPQEPQGHRDGTPGVQEAAELASRREGQGEGREQHRRASRPRGMASQGFDPADEAERQHQVVLRRRRLHDDHRHRQQPEARAQPVGHGTSFPRPREEDHHDAQQAQEARKGVAVAQTNEGVVGRIE